MDNWCKNRVSTACYGSYELALFTRRLSAISEENVAASEETAASTAELNERVKQIIREAVRLKKLSVELKKQIGIFQMT